ncbi:MarR family winged helix-turn-helix transcriptional regulator [Algicola sagamiensis]|uniref:MarR family winged helix-turn-helix transcriptional regulator n=1 Tax=Algicola sagamiensis TaxID=163869 RepID=UPI000370D3A1|nr:MarR family transcriptional regulator [Algicola sagamiensis]
MQDHVGQILEQWERQRPDLDCSPMGIIGRLNRASVLISKELQHVFRAHQLSQVEFDILATMRRNNQPLTPTELYQELMLSSGAMSTRIEHLVQRGMIQRIASEGDRRSCYVNLTAEGLELIDKVVGVHVENLNRILAPFSDSEKEQLAGFLKRWLLEKEEAR